MSSLQEWDWIVMAEDQEVHRLLCASDAYHATRVAPAPTRNPATTRSLVAAGFVHGLCYNGTLVGMFTLSEWLPYGIDEQSFTQAKQPVYLQRFAVAPEWLERDALVGLRCVRRALNIAQKRGCDVIRAEANPDLVRVLKLLLTFGFRQCGPVKEEHGRRAVLLERILQTPTVAIKEVK